MAKSMDRCVVARARELIADKRHWTQSWPAVSSDGQMVVPDSAKAVRFCAIGALLRSALELSRNLPLSQVLCDRVCTELVPGHVSARHAVEDINDADGGHEAVLALFDAYLRREAHVN
jgi:hypothetical protein